ncbi:MAG: hypothetical protein EOP50_21680, partial [Sphingobacteriales bacterium]
MNPIVTPTFNAIAAFCYGSTAPTLQTTSNNGITGTWSPATISNTASGTYNFTPTAGQCANTASISVTVDPASVGGTPGGNQVVCVNSAPSDITLSGFTGLVVKWQRSGDASFASPVDINVASAVLPGASVGAISADTFIRAVVQSGSCGSVYSSVITLSLRSTIWNGSAWSNGVPDSATTTFITGNYTASSNLNACTVTVSNNAVVNIPTGFDVTLNGALTVSSGSFTLENNANFLQTTSAANSGNIVVKRNSSAIKRQDYTLWSSPVTGQNLLAFSPLTVVTPTSRFYQYNSSTNTYNPIASPGSATFNDAQGYLIRVANNHPTFAWIWNGQFTGVPH